ncbi:MAG TPA: lysylphosphatidylglycerol synthase transmembrane domain-containing protein [Polyangiaceae bacterium]|nr:lysylphosphatidylglycerol synthase transmembrane domain-containing protein [Polyangiaceae bacterium]
MTSPALSQTAARARPSHVAVRRFLVAMLFAVVVYGGFAVWTGFGRMAGELQRFGWWAFAAACGLALGNYLVRWLKWEFYLARLGITGVSRLDSLLTFLSGFVLTVTPGKVGEVFKSVVLSETHGVPVERTAAIVVAERLTDVIGVVVLIVVGSLGFSGGLLWAGLGSAAVLVVLGVVASKRASHAIIALVDGLPRPFAGVGPKLHAAYDSLATMVRPANLVAPTLLSIVAWSLECAALWTILRGLGQTTGFELAMFFYATSTLAGALVPVPGGLGVTEGSLQGWMQEFGHIPRAASTAAMILVRFATLWFAVLVGFVSLSLLKRRHPGLLAGAAARGVGAGGAS